MSDQANKSQTTLLEQLFPTPANIAMCVHRSSGMHVTWHQSAAALQAAALRAAPSGEVYFSFATYKTPTSRTLTNLHRINALVLDIDVGKPNSHATLEEATKALKDACAAIRMPDPHVVHSGGGLHCYWPLVNSAPVLAWRAVSAVLVSKLMAAGLKADVAPSTNAVGLLRVPGTLNNKYDPPVKVRRDSKGRVDSEGGHKSFDLSKVATRLGAAEVTKEIERLKAAATLQKQAPATPLPNMVTYGGDTPFKVTTARTTWETPDRARLGPIMAGCEQMRLAPAGAEPLWREGLAVARLCGDGDTTALEWSKTGGNRFSEPATVHKLHLLQQQQGDKGFPTSCATLDKLNVGVCARCPNYQRIKNPIMLGREPAPVEAPPPVIAPDPIPIATAVLPGLVLPQFTRPVLEGIPFREEGAYSLSAEGLPQCRIKGDTEGDLPLLMTLCPFHIRPVCYARGKANGEWEDTVVWSIPDGPHGDMEVQTPTRLLGDITAVGPLLKLFTSQGIMWAEQKAMKKFFSFLIVYYQQVQKALPRSDRSTSFGWHGKSFLTAHSQFTPKGQQNKVFHQGIAQSRLRAMGEVGDGGLDAWLPLTRVYKEQGRMDACYALMQAFASPLMPFSGVNGSLVHLFSKDSARGKSTMLESINSVWGHGKELMLTRTGTVVANALLMSAHHNLPVCIDEVTNSKGAWASDLLYAVSQGRDKDRGTKDSGLQDTGTWQLIAITTGNNSLRMKLGSNGRSDSEAENARCIEIPFSAREKDDAAARILSDAMLDGQGHAGEAYAQWLTANRAQLDIWVQDAKERWSAKVDASSVERFWVANLAVTEVAFHLSQAAGLHDFKWADMEQYLIDVMIPHQRMEVKDAAVDANPAPVNDMLRELRENTILFNDKKVQLNSTRPGFPSSGREDIDASGGRHVWLPSKVIDDWAKKNDAHKRELTDGLKKDFGANYMLKRIVPGEQPVQCWHIHFPKPIDQEEHDHAK